MPNTAEDESRTNIGAIGDVLSRIEDAEKVNGGGHEAPKPPPEIRREAVGEDEEL